MQDIEIARKAKLDNINEIAKKINIPEEYVENYGKNKAKISYEIEKELNDKKNGKLILVTSINPTPLGEGKTTVSIGLADSLNKIGKKTILTLREPSIGPVFGVKGGATGGGYAQVVPMEEINLHFTGDMHAITSANNLLSAMIDNHIYHGNELGIEKVTWQRCMDVNDRQLRKIETGLSNEKGIEKRKDSFVITAASEIMAILCLSQDLIELKERLSKIVIGYNKKGEAITAHDLKAEGAMLVLLKDAIKPNLVQTIENNPVFIHGGPFANIAHGCNSVIATKIALRLADYTVTEAGFGADLGAEKFLDIKCRRLKRHPDAVVIVATIKALKYNSGIDIKDIEKENIEAIDIGCKNLLKHIDNIKNKFGLNVIVALNKFTSDTENEIRKLKEILEKEEVQISIVESWEKGSKGAIDLAQKVSLLCDKENDFRYMYDLDDSIKEKIEKVAKNIYGAKNVEYSKDAEEMIEKIEYMEYANLPICIAKTQYSFSDDSKNLLCDKPFTLHVKEIQLKAGAKFIVVLTGKIMTMPGLPKKPAAEIIDIDNNGEIIGLY